jgi:hypothetical protein
VYKIVNYDSWRSHPKLFNDFKTAFMVQQLTDPIATIEDWSSGSPEIVYDYRWGLLEMNKISDINNIPETNVKM